jgi:NADH dehydrogenase FAD-containing subunit
VDLWGLKLHGPAAWLIWRVIYLDKLPGWQNRTLVMLDWVFSLFFERSTHKKRRRAWASIGMTYRMS